MPMLKRDRSFISRKQQVHGSAYEGACARKAFCKPFRALSVTLACCACLMAPPCAAAAQGADMARPKVEEAHIPRNTVEAQTEGPSNKTLEKNLREKEQAAGSLLDPASRIWAGAQALLLRLESSAALVDSGVIAHAGDATAAAASHADGRIRVFGAGNCSALSMPGGHPAYALAISRRGNALAAWAQGVNRLVTFDLQSPGCPAATAESAMRGRLSLTLSASGTYLAAQDPAGNLWLGLRGGEMRLVATLPGAPAALGFSEAEGVLLAVDAQGRGGAWSARAGKRLKTWTVPEGPFERGELRGEEVWLWTANGGLVRWHLLRGRAVAQDPGIAAEAEPGKAAPEAQGWLELRGTGLFHVRPGLSWSPKPLYEFRQPSLSASNSQKCLRLSDVDGEVRYYDAQKGLPSRQCLADDWTQVVVMPDGTARIPGLTLRVFDLAAGAPSGSKVNSRAISESIAMLWTDSPPPTSLQVDALPPPAANGLRKVADKPQAKASGPVRAYLRQGLADEAPVRTLILE